MKRYIFSFAFLLISILINAQNDKVTILQDLEKSKPSEQGSNLTATLKSASRLFGEKGDLTTVIVVIPSGTVVDVIGSDSTYLHVVYGEDEGYIYKRQAVINTSEEAADVSAQKEAASRGVEVASPQQGSRFTYLENKYGASMAARLIQGKIWKGMTSGMVMDSWGRPLKINRVISGNNINEEWIYKSTRLLIQDDVLTGWAPLK